MYQGFELKFSNFELAGVASACGSYSGGLLEIGERAYRSFKRGTMLKIASYSGDSNSAINGNEIEEKWFPKVQCHVFISHSHADEKFALILAGALKKQMGLDAFVDSAVWGFRDDLINKLYGEMYGRTTNHLARVLGSVSQKLRKFTIQGACGALCTDGWDCFRGCLFSW